VIYDAKDDLNHQPPEIIVGAGKLTAIFFATAVICGTCFGFGYSLGRYSAAKAAETVETPSTASATSANKPMPGSAQDAVAVTTNASTDAPSIREEVVAPPSPPPAPAAKSAPAPDAAPPPHSTANSASADRSYLVQVAAVSRPKDADTLVAALQRKGYRANAIASPQDHLVHVQVGPFSNAKDAHATQDHLSNDGYLAILK